MGKKIMKILVGLGYLGVHVASQVVITIIVTAVISFRYMMDLEPSVNPLSMEVQTELIGKVLSNINMILLISSLVAVGVYYIIFMVKKKNMWKEVKLSNTKSINFIVALVLGTSAFFINNVFVTLIQISGVFQNSFSEFEELTGGMVTGNILFAILVVGIVVPFVEELLFRGLILNTLSKGFGVVTAIILQGVVFGIYHGNLIQGIYASFLGILYGYVVYKTRSLWTGIIMHMVNNILAVVLPILFGESIATIGLIVLSVVGLVGVVSSILLINKNNKEQVESLKVDTLQESN